MTFDAKKVLPELTFDLAVDICSAVTGIHFITDGRIDKSEFPHFLGVLSRNLDLERWLEARSMVNAENEKAARQARLLGKPATYTITPAPCLVASVFTLLSYEPGTPIVWDGTHALYIGLAGENENDNRPN